MQRACEAVVNSGPLRLRSVDGFKACMSPNARIQRHGLALSLLVPASTGFHLQLFCRLSRESNNISLVMQKFRLRGRRWREYEVASPPFVESLCSLALAMQSAAPTVIRKLYALRACSAEACRLVVQRAVSQEKRRRRDRTRMTTTQTSMHV